MSSLMKEGIDSDTAPNLALLIHIAQSQSRACTLINAIRQPHRQICRRWAILGSATVISLPHAVACMRTTTLGMQMCASNCVAAALPPQCLAWLPGLVRHPTRRPPPSLARGSQTSTTHQASGCYSGNCLCHPTCRSYPARDCTLLIRWLALPAVTVMTRLALEDVDYTTVSLSQKFRPSHSLQGIPTGSSIPDKPLTREPLEPRASASKTPRFAGKLYVAGWSSGGLDYSPSVLHMGRHLCFHPLPWNWPPSLLHFLCTAA